MNRRSDPLLTSADPANRLGLDYRAAAQRFTWRPRSSGDAIIDVHTHLNSVAAARQFFEAADLYNIGRVWSMSQLEVIDELRDAFGERLQFIAVPNYAAADLPDTFTTDWLRRIEGFAEKGVRVCKFWAAPRGRDFHPALTLDSPVRQEAMRLARSLGMIFMTHVADPDIWFATQYADRVKYGTKAEHYAVFERMLEQFDDVPWLAAHMGGDPEHLDHLDDMLARHPHLYLDTSATKWMVRELGRQPQAFAAFCRRWRGRVLFGSDIVAGPGPGGTMHEGFELFASRYWALRTLLETGYDGPSPIVDPDLARGDASVPEDATAHLRGAQLDRETLDAVYHDAAAKLLLERRC